MRENHYVKALFSPREGHLSLRWIKRIICDKAKGLRITSERYIGEMGVRCLSTINRAQDSAATVSYRSSSRPILLHAATYIGRLSDQYRFVAPPPKELKVKSKEEPLLPARKGTERRGTKSAARRSVEGELPAEGESDLLSSILSIDSRRDDTASEASAFARRIEACDDGVRIGHAVTGDTHGR